MTAVETAERLVENMSSEELARFRKWFAEFDGDAWDKQIEEDAAAGKLDFLREEALAEYREGRATPI
jgi:hypothetical protein